MAAGNTPSRTMQLQKVEWIKSFKQNQKQISVLEKEIHNHLVNKRSECSDEFYKLSDQHQKLTNELGKEVSKINLKRRKLQERVTQFKRKVESVDPTKPDGLEAIRSAMEDIESEIRTFKDHQRKLYESLMRDHAQLDADLTQLQQQMQHWDARTEPISSRATATRVISTGSDNADLPPEVAAFDRFLQTTGGPRGGWDEYDHGTFMRHRNRHKGATSFISEVIRALVTRTEPEVREHELWFQQYLQLQDDKRQAIAAWKTEKEFDKEEATQSVLREEQERRERVKQKEQEQAAVKLQRHVIQKTRISAWKVKKALEKAEEEERLLREKFEKREKEERKRQDQEEQRLLLSARREQRQLEHAENAAREAELNYEMRRHRGQVACENLQRFRERDKISTRQKQYEKQRAEEEKLEKQRRLDKLKSQVEVKVSRDPSRLLQPTAGWKERQKADRSSAGRVYSMPHRAVPGWRQGLS